MRTNFNDKVYGQRWQIETVFSMIKRNFGSALRARNIESQAREMLLLVLTHNIAIIQLVKEFIYRVCLAPFGLTRQNGDVDRNHVTDIDEHNQIRTFQLTVDSDFIIGIDLSVDTDACPVCIPVFDIESRVGDR